MLRMAVGHSDEFEASAAVAEALEQCAMALKDVAPQAGILLAGPDLDTGELLRLVRDAYPHIQLIGSTTGGEMSSIFGFGENTFILTLFASDVLEFAAGVGRHASQGARAACREAVEMAGIGDTALALCIALPTVVGIDPDDVLAELSSLVGPDVPVIGGGSAVEDERAEQWGGDHQFYGDELLVDAVPVLFVSGPLLISVGVAHGWKPATRMGTVTRSHGNVVYEIDGQPARKFYERFMPTGTGNALATPLAIFAEDGESFFLRGAFGFGDDGSASYLGTVPEGSSVQIASVAASDEILAGTDTALHIALDDFPGDAPEAAFVVSCAARKWLLGARTSLEIDRIRETLGPETPVSGFYAYGEIAPLGNEARFHNETCVAVLLGT